MGPVVLLGDALGVAIGVFGAYIGLQLWRVRPGAVHLTRVYLLLVIVIEFTGVGIPYLLGLPRELSRQLLWPNVSGATATAAVVGVWWLYFRRSKRVLATYGNAGPNA